MQQEMDFGVFATAQCNHARRMNSPPQPDADGLFDLEGVTIICGRRQCHVEPVSDLFVDVQFKETKIRLPAIAPGRWDAVAILSACARAHGNRVYTVDYEKVAATNTGGLDELRIASVVGADGVRPYLSKKGKWGVDANGRVFRPRRPDMYEPFIDGVLAENPTWAFMCVLKMPEDGMAKTGDYNVRRALRALEDAGLVRIELGPRGGMATAKCFWTHRAYLAPSRLAPADEEAMEMLA